MIELKPGAPTDSLLRQLPELRQSVTNSGSALNWQEGQTQYLRAVERLEATFGHSFLGTTWSDQLHATGYWAVQQMSETSPRPFPLLKAEIDRLDHWLGDFEQALQRIATQDEWDEENVPRLVLDTDALVREGSFDTFDWLKVVNSPTGRVRLIIPILVVREMDDLKNYAKTPKARPRLRKVFNILDGRGRGPTSVAGGTTLELLMDPPGHTRATSHDEEIVRRAVYLAGRRGGPLKLITGDYTMVFTAQAEGVAAELTPAELTAPAPDE